MVDKCTYLLDFLGLKDTYSERDLESAILRELESFIMEFGSDFSFVARQKRIVIDDEDFYIDLLFYHRGLRRLIAIELKLGRFKPADKGQVELYLRWLDKHERREGEGSPRKSLGSIPDTSMKWAGPRAASASPSIDRWRRLSLVSSPKPVPGRSVRSCLPFLSRARDSRDLLLPRKPAEAT